MGTKWKKVDNKCIICGKPVGKIYIKNGKIIVEKYYDNWGCWQKVPNKSEMKVMCCYCQKQKAREERRLKRYLERKKQLESSNVNEVSQNTNS